MRFGWIEPRVYDLTDSGSCTYLEAAQNGGSYLTENRRPIFLYNPAQGPNQYFALEYRWPKSGTYDANAADQGLAVWYISTNPDKTLPQIVGLNLREGSDGILQTVPAVGSDDVRSVAEEEQWIWAGPDRILQTRPAAGSDDFIETDAPVFVLGAPDALRGVSSLWKNTDGLFRLRLQLDRWLDESENNLHLQVSPVSDDTPIMEVEWGFGKPFTAHINKLVGSHAGPPGSQLTLDGLFGVSNGGRVVSLTDGTETYDLEVVSWSCTRISVRIPEGVPAGSYKLRVYTDGSHATGSNAELFTVEDAAAITISPEGGSLTIPDDGSIYVFPSGTFSETVIFHHARIGSDSEDLPSLDDLLGLDRFFHC